MLIIYKKGKIVYQTRLFQTFVYPPLAFLLLPLRSLVIFLQILFHTYRLNSLYGPFDIYFTVNAFIAWTGIILRNLGLVKKTVFWVWDYYPPIDKNKIVMFMRWLYWQFDKPASQKADSVVFLNHNLLKLRKRLGILPSRKHYEIVEIGTNPVVKHTKKNTKKKVRIVFLGVLKKIQGLDLFFDAASLIYRKHPNISLDIIGGGPDEVYFQKRAHTIPIPVTFHGYIADESCVDRIISKCHIGIAPYKPDKSNCMYFTDPSKIKRYIGLGLPVITTNVFEFSKKIDTYHAGFVIPYTPQALSNAIDISIKNYSKLAKQAYSLSRQYYYASLYEKLFK